MAISLGRLRPDTQYDYKFVGLSHNTLRGAAGGARTSGGTAVRRRIYHKKLTRKTKTEAPTRNSSPSFFCIYKNGQSHIFMALAVSFVTSLHPQSRAFYRGTSVPSRHPLRDGRCTKPDRHLLKSAFQCRISPPECVPCRWHSTPPPQRPLP